MAGVRGGSPCGGSGRSRRRRIGGGGAVRTKAPRTPGNVESKAEHARLRPDPPIQPVLLSPTVTQAPGPIRAPVGDGPPAHTAGRKSQPTGWTGIEPQPMDDPTASPGPMASTRTLPSVVHGPITARPVVSDLPGCRAVGTPGTIPDGGRRTQVWLLVLTARLLDYNPSPRYEPTMNPTETQAGMGTGGAGIERYSVR